MYQMIPRSIGIVTGTDDAVWTVSLSSVSKFVEDQNKKWKQSNYMFIVNSMLHGNTCVFTIDNNDRYDTLIDWK